MVSAGGFDDEGGISRAGSLSWVDRIDDAKEQASSRSACYGDMTDIDSDFVAAIAIETMI